MANGGVPASQLASLFGCDEKTIRNLAGKGIVVRAGRGEYQPALSIKNYIGHLREVAAGRQGADEKVDPATEGGLLKREMRRNYVLKNAILEGSAVRVEDVAPAWARVVRAVRAAMLAVPGKARFALPHLTAFDEETLEQIVRQQLEDAALADTPPEIDDRPELELAASAPEAPTPETG
jgi:phage terminase Nu1 subunit (DNA packaging protein)